MGSYGRRKAVFIVAVLTAAEKLLNYYSTEKPEVQLIFTKGGGNMIPKPVQSVLHTLETAGFQGWAVGGCVRDILRGAVPSDWDVTTDARPQQVMALFGDSAVPTGLRHGTVTVKQEGMAIEVTTFRCDGVYTDHRRPDTVRFSHSLEEDLARRDLTVNAMAMDVRGRMADPFGGREDLEKGILRCVGEPERRFDEDALRIMRTLRFAAVLGFTIEEETAASLRRKAPLLRAIAVERLLVETDKLLLGNYMADVLLAYPDVLGVFLPEILPCVGLDQRNPHHCYDVWEHCVRAASLVPAETGQRWAALLHDVGKPPCFTVDEAGVGHFYGHGKRSEVMAEEICRRLRMDNHRRERIVTLVSWHDRDIPRTEQSIGRALRRLGEDTLRQLIDLKRADNGAQSEVYRSRSVEMDKAESILNGLLARESCFSLKQLAVNGRDMMALGLQGAAVGEMLNTLLDAVVDGAAVNEKDALLTLARQRMTE